MCNTIEDFSKQKNVNFQRIKFYKVNELKEVEKEKK